MKRVWQHVVVILLVGPGFFLSLGAFVNWVSGTWWAFPFLVIGVLSMIVGFKLANRWGIHIYISLGDGDLL